MLNDVKKIQQDIKKNIFKDSNEISRILNRNLTRWD